MQSRVKTEVYIQAPPDRVWKLLCDARLPLTAPCCFRIGVPTPEKCMLVSEAGAVGARRQCQTSKGVIHQRITQWDPPRVLSFSMESNTLQLEKHLSAMSDTFTIRPDRDGCWLSRETTFSTIGWFAFVKAWVFRISVWNIHRYVMRNFKVLGEAA